MSPPAVILDVAGMPRGRFHVFEDIAGAIVARAPGEVESAPAQERALTALSALCAMAVDGHAGPRHSPASEDTA